MTLTPAWRFLVKQELALLRGREDASETVTMEQASYVFFNARNRPGNCDRLGGAYEKLSALYGKRPCAGPCWPPSFVGAAVGQCALSLLSVYEEITLVGADSHRFLPV